MRIGKKSASSPAASALPHAHVGAAEYPLMAMAAVAANGGEGFVVERNRTSEQWRAWMAYFDRMELPGFDKQGRAYTINRGRVYEGMQSITVPTKWPLEFDDSAPLPRPLRRDDMPIGPERKRELAAMLRKLGETIAAGSGKPRSADAPPVTPEQKLAELARRYAGEPVTVGAPLARYLGVKPEAAE